MPTAITEWSEAMMTSLAAAMAMFFAAIPKILGFAVILIVGWFLASLVEKGVAALLRAVRFNELASRSGFAGFMSKMNPDAGSGVNADGTVARQHAVSDPAGMIGLIAKWFVRLIAAVVAFDALGLPAVSEVLRELLLWLPNVVVALVVLVIGGLAARALSNLVRGAAGEAGLGQADLLAKVASALVWAFAIVVAVNQIGIATTLVNTLFMAFVGAIALGLGLAFGLGGRETAGQIVSKWYSNAQHKSAQLAHAAEAGGRMASGGMPAGGGTGAPYGGSQGSGSPVGGSGMGPGGAYQGSGYQGGNYQGGTYQGGQYEGGSAGGAYGTGANVQPRGGAGVPETRDQPHPTPLAQRHLSDSGY